MNNMIRRGLKEMNREHIDDSTRDVAMQLSRQAQALLATLQQIGRQPIPVTTL